MLQMIKKDRCLNLVEMVSTLVAFAALEPFIEKTVYVKLHGCRQNERRNGYII